MNNNVEIYEMLIDTRNKVFDAYNKNYKEMVADKRVPIEALKMYNDEKSMVLDGLDLRIATLRSLIDNK